LSSRFHRHLTQKVSDGTPAPRWGAIQVPRKKGGENVKKKLIAVLIIALTLMLMPTVSAKKAIKCTHEIWFDGAEAKWFGDVVFPDGSTYKIIWYIDPDPDFVGHKKSPVFPEGKVEKFYEYFELREDSFDGPVLLEGYDTGIFDADSWKYVMNGKVTYAAGALSYLAGAKVHCKGVAWIEDTFYGEGTHTFSGYEGW